MSDQSQNFEPTVKDAGCLVTGILGVLCLLFGTVLVIPIFLIIVAPIGAIIALISAIKLVIYVVEGASHEKTDLYSGEP